jgi:hypothetical protein
MKHLFYVLLCGLLFLDITGCSAKKTTQKPGEPKTVETALGELKAAMVKVSPETQDKFRSDVVYPIRYAKLDVAVANLKTMAGDASLNAQQKDAVNSLIQAIEKDQSAAQPAAQPAAQ